MGGSARRRFAWANAQAQGPRLRDPPEIRIQDFAPPGAFGRLPTIGDDRYSRGRAHRPGQRAPSRFVPKATKVPRRALARHFTATEGHLRDRRESPWGQTTDFGWPGDSRGRNSALKTSDRQLSPANHPARHSGARPKRDLEQRTDSELRPGSRRKTVALSFIDGLAAADKASASGVNVHRKFRSAEKDPARPLDLTGLGIPR